MENEPIPVESSVIPLKDNPTQLIRQATDVAGVCREIVLKTACNIQGKKYVKCEGWMAIATAHGCLASSRDVQKVDGGFTAIGEIRRISDGVVLATAEGFVGRDEKRWSTADEYACRAMVQTRAISRACRAAFAHVVVMMDAGLSTTPFEEVPDGGFQNASGRLGGSSTPTSQPKAQPAPSSAARPAAKTADVATPKPAEIADNDQKFRFLMALSEIRTSAIQYFVQKGWLTDTQPLDELDLKYVPTTKKAYDSIMAELDAFIQGDQKGEDWWRTFKVPFGKHKDVELAKLEKNVLYGFFMNFEPTEEYNGNRKSDEAIKSDKDFREALSAAGTHYDFKGGR